MLSKIKTLFKLINSKAKKLFVKGGEKSDCVSQKSQKRVIYNGHAYKITLLACFCIGFFAMFLISRGQNMGGVSKDGVYSMYLGKSFMGIADSPKDGLDCLESAKQKASEIVKQETDVDADIRFSLSVGKVSANQRSLTDNLFDHIMKDYKVGTGLYVDGELISVNTSREVVEDFADMVKSSAINNACLSVPGKVLKVEIKNDIRIDTGYYHVDSFKTNEYLYSLKKSFVDEKMMLRSVERVSSETRMSALYESAVVENKHIIDCDIEYTTEKQREIPHNVDYILDENRPAGEVEIICMGRDGIVSETSLVTIKGTNQTIVPYGEEVLKQPVNGIISIGTAVQINSPSRSQDSGFEWPNDGIVSSPFGNRSGGFHWGIDICNPEGSVIKAAKDGVVVFSGYKDNGYGNYVIIQHNEEESTLYSHNSSNSVEVGDFVVKGQEVAKMGMTGRASGSHVHFEVRINGVRENPENYLPKRD